MNREILDRLSVITEEEQEILSGRQGIDPTRYTEKKELVIDEFPYLVKTNSAFPSILQNAWDEILKDNNVMLILSGSLIGMMQKHALSYDSPLYGRRTAQMRLAPLPFTDI